MNKTRDRRVILSLLLLGVNLPCFITTIVESPDLIDAWATTSHADALNNSTRTKLCSSQIGMCTVSCQGKVITNTCDADTLTWNCTCRPGASKPFHEWQFPVPFQLCVRHRHTCLQNCNADMYKKQRESKGIVEEGDKPKKGDRQGKKGPPSTLVPQTPVPGVIPSNASHPLSPPDTNATLSKRSNAKRMLPSTSLDEYLDERSDPAIVNKLDGLDKEQLVRHASKIQSSRFTQKSLSSRVSKRSSSLSSTRAAAGTNYKTKAGSFGVKHFHSSNLSSRRFFDPAEYVGLEQSHDGGPGRKELASTLNPSEETTCSSAGLERKSNSLDEEDQEGEDEEDQEGADEEGDEDEDDEDDEDDDGDEDDGGDDNIESGHDIDDDKDNNDRADHGDRARGKDRARDSFMDKTRYKDDRSEVVADPSTGSQPETSCLTQCRKEYACGTSSAPRYHSLSGPRFVVSTPPQTNPVGENTPSKHQVDGRQKKSATSGASRCSVGRGRRDARVAWGAGREMRWFLDRGVAVIVVASVFVMAVEWVVGVAAGAELLLSA